MHRTNFRDDGMQPRSDDGAQTSGKCVGRCPEVSTNNNNNEQLGREYAENLISYIR